MADQSCFFFNVSKLLFLPQDREKPLVSLKSTNGRVGYINNSHFVKVNSLNSIIPYNTYLTIQEKLIQKFKDESFRIFLLTFIRKLCKLVMRLQEKTEVETNAILMVCR